MTIPASDLVNVTPGVLGAGGTSLSLNGLILTNGARVPIGTVATFASAAAVGAYFGLSSVEYAYAQVYFLGFNNSQVKPGAVLFAQYPQAAVPAFLRGATTGLTLAQLQALASGTITLTIDGNTITSSAIVLAPATSFSNAASIIQTALAENDASFTGVIAPATASVTASITATTMTVTAVASGTVLPGAVVSGGTTLAGTTVVSQLTGTVGGIGTYQVSASQTVTSGTLTATSTLGVLTVSGSVTGTIAVGQTIAGTGVTAGTQITGFLTGTGGTGTYIVNPTQTASSTTMTSGSATVTYDSVSGAFVITGGTPGATGTITAAATSTLATALGLTAATGAVTSQGSAAASPVSFMSGVVQITQNWATFSTAFEPATAQGVAFAQWTNSTNNRYAFIGWDTDPLALQSGQTTTLGAQVVAATYGGTFLLWQPTDLYQAPFVMGLVASVNFNAQNGRVNPTYKSQSGITPGVTSQANATQLRANGYNFYGSWATAAQVFQGLSPGSVTGPFLWFDAYVNQIWLNNALQLQEMNLLFQSNSIPYNAPGYLKIEAAAAGPIQTGVFNGVIQPGVALSPLQISELNAAAGLPIDRTIYQTGYYFQVLDPGATVRAVRGSPLITLWYADGGSVQQINIFSQDAQ